MEKIIKEVEEIDKWIDLCFQRGDLLDYNSLMDIGIQTANHIRKLSIITIGSMTEDEHHQGDKNFELCDAVIVGHLVRIFKLYDQLSYFISQNKGEISSIFSRLIFETFVIMKYLIIKGEPSIKNYIKVSFKSTIKEYDFIKNIERKRELSDIENRIRYKIENRLRNVELDPTELLNNRNWNLDNLTFKDIVNFLIDNDPDGLNWERSYLFVFGSSSAFIHGTWYDIEISHLTKVDGKYFPKMEYDKVDPRYILPQSIFPTRACIDFLKWRKSDPVNFLTNIFLKIEKLLLYLNEMDEIRIKNKK